ncbi:MAG: hypothetical protein ISR96_03900 [Nitrospira sp.]|nr:hypothetical protein [bacterium]MBL7048656.1 hypothetical protein [Nitrospira sp.]
MSPLSKKIVKYQASIVLNDKCCRGTIENLSAKNIYLNTASNIQEIMNATEFKLEFQPDSGEKMDLNCRVTNAYRIPPYGITSSVSMEIIEPSSSYRDFFNALI